MGKRSTRSARSKQARKNSASLELLPLFGFPEVRKGDRLTDLIIDAARASRVRFQHGDIVVVAQKIVSKAEGQILPLSTVQSSPKAQRLAARLKKDARLIEVILRESRRIVRSHAVLITETHHGFVCANAGVDHSNVPGDDMVSLLPLDPDRSARSIATALRKRTRKRLAVIISDTFGRPWRLGLINVAIGAARLQVLHDLRGTQDRDGKVLQGTILAVADELAAAAGLLMGKAAGVPAVVVRGYSYRPAREAAARVIRPVAEDLFR